MPALVHTTFRVSNAKQFKESFEEKKENGIGGYIPASLYSANPITFEPELTGDVLQSQAESIPTYALDDQIYLFIGRVSRWTAEDDPANEVDGTINPNYNENNPPFPVDSMKDSHFNHWDDMIAAKRVSDDEVSHVIKRERSDEIAAGVRNWRTGLRYEQYDSRDPDMFDDDMLIHTLNNKFRVYKCLKQGVGRFTKTLKDDGADSVIADYKKSGGANTIFMWNYQSTREPLERDISCDPPNGNVTEDFMVTGDEFNDGYQWKYYYTIDAGQALKFVTTSYIPVKRLRKENGSIVDDSSDQYVVESASIPGGILNVVPLKKEANGFDTSGVRYGYDTRGGDGYFQFAAKDVEIECDPFLASPILKFHVPMANVDPTDLTKYTACDWPREDIAITYAGADANDMAANNRFDFSTPATNAHSWFNNNSSMVGYGVVIKASDLLPTDINAGGTMSPGYDQWKKYVFPISAHTINAGNHELTIDPTFLKHLFVYDPLDPTINAGEIKLSVDGVQGLEKFAISAHANNKSVVEIHPIVKIDTNFQSTTESDLVDAFQAYAIVEPKFDADNEVYIQGEPGRVLDVRVTNPGRYHYRVDKTYLTPNVADTAYTSSWALDSGVYDEAIVWACIPPVGGHGWDPVEELGGFNVMINARFEGDESDEFTVKNEFRKIGILKNPLHYTSAGDLNQLWMSDAIADPTSYTELFREFKTDQCYRIGLDNAEESFGVDPALGFSYVKGSVGLLFEPDMTVSFHATTTLSSVATASGKEYVAGQEIARAKIVDHDFNLKRLRVIKPRDDWGTILQGGKFTIKSVSSHTVTGEIVTANTDDSNAGANTAIEPKMKPGSGKILYIENRSMVSRSENQTEDLKISIQF